MIPGEVISEAGIIQLNAGRKTLRVTVVSTGDRSIQIGSHYRFFEARAPGRRRTR